MMSSIQSLRLHRILNRVPLSDLLFHYLSIASLDLHRMHLRGGHARTSSTGVLNMLRHGGVMYWCGLVLLLLVLLLGYSSRTPFVIVFVDTAFTREEVRSAFFLGGGTFVVAFSCVQESEELGATLGGLESGQCGASTPFVDFAAEGLSLREKHVSRRSGRFGFLAYLLLESPEFATGGGAGSPVRVDKRD